MREGKLPPATKIGMIDTPPPTQIEFISATHSFPRHVYRTHMWLSCALFLQRGNSYCIATADLPSGGVSGNARLLSLIYLRRRFSENARLPSSINLRAVLVETPDFYRRFTSGLRF